MVTLNNKKVKLRSPKPTSKRSHFKTEPVYEQEARNSLTLESEVSE